jgi:hypothetical protein
MLTNDVLLCPCWYRMLCRMLASGIRMPASGILLAVHILIWSVILGVVCGVLTGGFDDDDVSASARTECGVPAAPSGEVCMAI